MLWAADICGVSDLLDRPIHALSYGQKKRVALAGVLAMGPRVLVLDEPTASLDPMAEAGLMRLLKYAQPAGADDHHGHPRRRPHPPVRPPHPPAAPGEGGGARGRWRRSSARAPTWRAATCACRASRTCSTSSCEEAERPLTVGQARKELVRMVERGQLDLVPILLHGTRRGRRDERPARRRPRDAIAAPAPLRRASRPAPAPRRRRRPRRCGWRASRRPPRRLRRRDGCRTPDAPSRSTWSFPAASRPPSPTHVDRGRHGLGGQGRRRRPRRDPRPGHRCPGGRTPGVFAVRAGDGVGTVTLPGLPIAPGRPAINPVPRDAILGELAPGSARRARR